MRRSEQLAGLSREHHHALRYALQLKKGVAAGRPPEQLCRFVEAVALEHLLPHFALEESALISRLTPEQREASVIRRMLDEHREMPELADALAGGGCADDQALLRFVEMLKAHVRLEENEVFPLLEELLSPQALEEVRAEIEAGHKFSDIGWE